MAISKQIESAVKNSSMIRKMFEEGARRIQKYGAENVFDFSIGNPIFEPPPELKQSLLKILQSEEKGMHRYMPNPGYPKTREYIADQISAETGLSFTIDDVVMTTGAGGALNVIFRTLLNPGDEVVILKPYFVEYDFYITNHGGTPKKIDTDETFRIDFDLLEEALTPNVKAVLINSPNNPTGVIYSKEELDRLGQLLAAKSIAFGHPITLLSDEPYKNISYDVDVPSIFNAYANSIVVTSYSKDLAIPGERIGYIAIAPDHQDRKILQEGSVIALRILGFVNAPAIWQHVIPMVGTAKVDLEPYRKNRDILYEHLTKCGFDCIKPDGGFYLFPKSAIDDDKEFVKTAQELNLLLVPGSGFGTPGFFRIAYCFDTDMIERSLPVFTKLAQHYRLI